ncbi:tail fiber protein [Croceivirga radicis]|uniref:tail fiber protein n=1 Tax=Croceivirga radicis TaxID=1929488 RepID=UPI000255B318|nr:tail fiber protein [Croceivirga radicis]
MLSIIFYAFSKNFEGSNVFKRDFKTKQLQLLFLFSFSFAFLHAQNPLTDYVWSSEDTNISSAVVQGVDPFGNQSNLLEITSDGNWRGFAINNISINPNLTYRFSFWVKANAIVPNYTFTGKVTSTNGIINDNATITNDFYLQSGWALPGANNWYLYVGYINGTGDSNTYTGVVYDTTGLITNLGTNNYIFSGNANSLSFGASSNSSDNNTKIIYFDPRIQVVSNGNNSVDDLLVANSTPSSDNASASIWSETGNNATYLGNVGIGTNSPYSKLHVMSNNVGAENLARFQSSDANGDYLAIVNATGSEGQFMPRIVGHHTTDNRYSIQVSGATSDENDTGQSALVSFDARRLAGPIQNRPLFVWTNYADEKMTMLANGNVGIGTSLPDAPLTVNGRIHAEEVKVDLSVPGPDYVFKEDYDLKTLEEVNAYIKANGHLPNIPSAKEMETNGICVSVMNMKLLEKIEELTLYILMQEKRIQQLENLIK